MKFTPAGQLTERGLNYFGFGFRMALLLLLFFSSSIVHAQKEDEILKKFRIALRDCALDVPEPSVITIGSITMQNVTFASKWYYHKPNMRTEFTFQGATVILLDNDTIHWEYNPFINQHIIKKTDPVERDFFIRKSKALDFASKELFNYKALKNQLTFKGEQKVDSIFTYVFELKIKNSDLLPITFYLDKRTSLIYKCEYDSEVKTYANYRPIGKYIYPMLIAMKYKNETQVMKFDDLTIGKSIPDSLYIIPASAYASKKKSDQKIRILLTEGDSLLNNSLYDAAINTYNEVLRLDGNNYFAFSGRGLAKVNQKNYYEAIADLNIAVKINPKGSVALNSRGLSKSYVGDTKGALDDYTESIRVDTTMGVAYKNRGALYLQSSQYDKASVDYLKALSFMPTDGDTHLKYGVSIAQLERYEEAIISYRKAIELNCIPAELYNFLGVAEFKLEKYQESVVSFREAVKKDQENFQYLMNFGNGLYYSEEFKNAQTEFERCLKKDSKNAEVHNMIGLCKYRQEDFKGSIKDFTTAIELNNQSAVYHSNRASAKEEVQDYEGAISDYTESISRNPTDASNFFKRGLVKIFTSKKLEGCLDLGTAKDMKFEGATEAIMRHCN